MSATVLGGMNELTVSNDICGDWQALRARLRVDGYIFVRGLLDPALVGLARQQAMDAPTRSGWMTPDGRPLPPVRTAAATDAGFRGMAIAEALNRLPYERGPQQFMGLLAGDGAFVYPVKVPRVVYPDRIAPGHKGRFVHQDYAVIGKQDMFTMWMPLQQIPFEMGPLAVLPGSSRIGWASPRRLSPVEPNWATTYFEPGDALIFHCLTWHAALANTTDRVRLSVDVRWQLAADPAPRALIDGPGARQRPHNRELFSRLFARKPWWHPVPASVQTADTIAPPAGAPIQLSRYVDFPAGQRQPSQRATH